MINKSFFRQAPPSNGAFARTLAVLYLTCMVAGSLIMIHTPSAYEGILLSLLGFAFLGFMTSLQEDIYGFSKKKIAKLDERQMQLRRRVFEKSYIVLWCIIVAILFALGTMRQVTINLHYLTMVTVNIISVVTWLPALFATFEKGKA